MNGNLAPGMARAMPQLPCLLCALALLAPFPAAAVTIPPDSAQTGAAAASNSNTSNSNTTASNTSAGNTPPQPASSVPAAQPAAPAEAEPGDPDDADLDATLRQQAGGDRLCDIDKDYPQHVFTYDYTGGTVWEDHFQPGYPRYGRETDQRLYVGCGFGVMYEHLSSSLPDPDGAATMDTLAAVLHMEDRVFMVAFGIGATRYHTPQQSYTLASMPLVIRRDIIWGLSAEVTTTIPFSGLFAGSDYQFAAAHPNDPALNNLWEVVLRYDWKNVGLRFGKRSYQIGYTPAGTTQQYAIRRSGTFAGVSFRF